MAQFDYQRCPNCGSKNIVLQPGSSFGVQGIGGGEYGIGGKVIAYENNTKWICKKCKCDFEVKIKCNKSQNKMNKKERLEYKIKEALRLGITFYNNGLGTVGTPGNDSKSLIFNDSTKDDLFEKDLDRLLERWSDRQFVSILKELNVKI